MQNNKQSKSILKALPSIKEGNAFFVFMLLLVCFMGYINTVSETNPKDSIETTQYYSPIETFEDNSKDLVRNPKKAVLAAFYINQKILISTGTYYPETDSTSDDNRGSPEHTFILI
ncbi:MAG: hypothetical protein IAE93_02440 [Ignavibacteria bacterium]|nr:hypothetical protein [Ignavibacteria bacterium]